MACHPSVSRGPSSRRQRAAGLLRGWRARESEEQKSAAGWADPAPPAPKAFSYADAPAPRRLSVQVKEAMRMCDLCHPLLCGILRWLYGFLRCGNLGLALHAEWGFVWQ